MAAGLTLAVFGVCSHSVAHLMGTVPIAQYTAKGLSRVLSSMAGVSDPDTLIMVPPADMQKLYQDEPWHIETFGREDASDFLESLVRRGLACAELLQVPMCELFDDGDPRASSCSDISCVVVGVMLAAQQDPCACSSVDTRPSAPAPAAAVAVAEPAQTAEDLREQRAIKKAVDAINKAKKVPMARYLRKFVPGTTPGGKDPYTYALATDKVNAYTAGTEATVGYIMNELIITSGGATPKDIPIQMIKNKVYGAMRSLNDAVRNKSTPKTYGKDFKETWEDGEKAWQAEFGESFRAEKAQQQQPALRRTAAAGPFIPKQHLKFCELGKCASWTDAMAVLERYKDAAAAAAGGGGDGKAAAPGASRQRKRKASRQPAAAAAEQEEEAPAEQDDGEEEVEDEEQQQEEGAQGQQKQAIPERQRAPTAAAAGAAALVNSQQVAKRIKQASKTAAAAAAAAKADGGAGKKKGAAATGRGARKGSQRT